MSAIVLTGLLAAAAWFLYNAGKWVGAETIASDLAYAFENNLDKEIAKPLNAKIAAAKKGLMWWPGDQKFRIYLIRLRGTYHEIFEACRQDGMELQVRMDTPREGKLRVELSKAALTSIMDLADKGFYERIHEGFRSREDALRASDQIRELESQWIVCVNWDDQDFLCERAVNRLSRTYGRFHSKPAE
jgi:hypothetical protein